MKYPAIVYYRSDIVNRHASDGIYDQNYRYIVTVIDYDPDSEIVKSMTKFKYSVFTRHYTANGINHDQFTVSYLK